MAALKYVSNGQTIYPEVPLSKPRILIEDSRRQLNGTLRTAHYAEKIALSYGRGDLTEAELTTWLAAHPRNASFSHTDENSVTRTMKTVSLDVVLERTTPLVEGGADTTGDAYYRVDVGLEQV